MGRSTVLSQENVSLCGGLDARGRNVFCVVKYCGKFSGCDATLRLLLCVDCIHEEGEEDLSVVNIHKHGIGLGGVSAGKHALVR